MAQSAALLVLPSGESTGEERDAVQATPRLLTQLLEDLRLAERVAGALRATGCVPLRGIAVTVVARLVILDPRYFLKQVAQTTALAVAGVHRVRNDLDVGWPS
jgi:hypothetical protein